MDPLMPSSLSPLQWILLATLVVVQVGLLLWALLKLFRAPRERLTLPLVAWLLIVVFVNGFGAIAFLLFGIRKVVAAPTDPLQDRDSSAPTRAADLLYGGKR